MKIIGNDHVLLDNRIQGITTNLVKHVLIASALEIYENKFDGSNDNKVFLLAIRNL